MLLLVEICMMESYDAINKGFLLSLSYHIMLELQLTYNINSRSLSDSYITCILLLFCFAIASLRNFNHKLF